jgi:hypothetical protein
VGRHVVLTSCSGTSKRSIEQDGQDRIDRVDRTGRTGQNLHGMADWIDRKDGTVGKMLKGT